MDAPHASAAETEALLPGEHHGGGFMAGTAAPRLANPLAVVEGSALRCAFVGVASSHVEQLVGLGGHGECRLEKAHLVIVRAGVRDRRPQSEQSARMQFQFRRDLQTHPRVASSASHAGDGVFADDVLDGIERGRPRGIPAAAEQSRPADPSGRMLGEKRNSLLGHHLAVDERLVERCQQRKQGAVRDIPEVLAPVQHAGQSSIARVQHDAGTAAPQVDDGRALSGEMHVTSLPVWGDLRSEWR